jgi:hypothetical protein
MNIKKKSLSVILLAALTLMSACSQASTGQETPKPSEPAGTSAPDAATSTPAPEKKEEGKSQVNKVGDSVKIGNLTVTVNGVRESQGKDFKVEDGKVYIVVDVTAENNGTQDEAVSSALLTSVIDGDGFKYDIALNDDQKGNFDGTVGAGRKLRGEVSFAVRKQTASLEFEFNDLLGDGKGIWKLK